MAKKLQAVRPSPEILEQARGLLARSDVSAGSEVSLAHWLWIAQDAGDGGDVATLRVLEASLGDKGFQKGLRKIFHKLRSRGVDVEAKVGRRGISLALKNNPEYEGIAFMASVGGEYAAAVLRFVPGASQAILMMFRHLRDKTHMEALWVSRGEGRRMMRDLRGNDAEFVDWMTIPAEYAQYMMYDGLRDVRDARGEMDNVTTDVMMAVGQLPEEARAHPVLAMLESRGVSIPGSVGTSGDLMEDPFFRTFWAEERWLEACVEELKVIAESPLVLADYQMTERMREKVDATIDAMVAEAGQDAVAKGFYHSAYLCAVADRWSEAATVVRIAQLLEAGEPAHEIPLFVALFQQVLSLFQGQGRGGVLDVGEESAPLMGGAEPGIGRGGLWLPGDG